MKRLELASRSPVSSVCLGWHHAIITTSSGECFTVGANDTGQLGNGKAGGGKQAIPTHVSELPKARVAAAGSGHSAAVTENGQLWMWGRNNCGQLGLGHRHNVMVPTRVDTLDSFVITGVSCGDQHTVAWTDSGEVFAWGKGAACGHGGCSTMDSPLGVKAHVRTQQRGLEASECGQHALRRSDDEVSVIPTTTWWQRHESGAGSAISDVLLPASLSCLLGEHVVSVDCMGSFSIARVDNGSLYSWGSSLNGECGVHEENVDVAQYLDNSEEFTDISVGLCHAAAVSKDGKLHIWGAGDCGQRGDGTRSATEYLVATPDFRASQVSCGGSHTIVVDATGRILGCGANERGQAIATESCEVDAGYRISAVLRLTDVNGFPEGTVSQISAGMESSAAVVDGSVYLWGRL